MAAATGLRSTPEECTKRLREKPCAKGAGCFSSHASGNSPRLRRFWFFFRLLFFGLLSLRFFLFSLGRIGLLRAFAAGFGFLLGGLLFFFKQRPLLFFEAGTFCDVALAVEIDAAINQRFLDDGI